MTNGEDDHDRIQRTVRRAGRSRRSDPKARLHHKLERRATESGLLDVAFRTIDSPVGPLLLAATPLGLVRVAYQREGHDAVLQALASTISPRILAAPRRLDDVARQLDEYFAGRRTAFDVALDRRLSAGFRRIVLDHLAAISYGHTESYAEVAAATGHPGAMRAVGSACAHQPASWWSLPPGPPLGRLLGRLRRRAGGQASAPWWKERGRRDDQRALLRSSIDKRLGLGPQDGLDERGRAGDGRPSTRSPRVSSRRAAHWVQTTILPEDRTASINSATGVACSSSRSG